MPIIVNYGVIDGWLSGKRLKLLFMCLQGSPVSDVLIPPDGSYVNWGCIVDVLFRSSFP